MSGSVEVGLEATTLYKYDSSGNLQVAETKDWVLERVKRYCFVDGVLDQIQGTLYAEQCKCAYASN